MPFQTADLTPHHNVMNKIDLLTWEFGVLIASGLLWAMEQIPWES